MRNQNPLRVDPSRTAQIRKRLAALFRRRLDFLISQLSKLIVQEDFFKLQNINPFNSSVTNQTPRLGAPLQLVREFQRVLDKNVQTLMLGINTSKKNYWEPLIRKAYQKGQYRAYREIRKAFIKKSLSELEDLTNYYFGVRSKEEFARRFGNQPYAVEKMEQLSLRVESEIKGTSSILSQNIYRTLSDEVEKGSSAKQIATSLKATIKKVGNKHTRAIASSEIVRAHATGQLDLMEALGVTKVGVSAEWSTAEDDRVCPQCLALEGQVLSIEEARGLIPLHVGCRCAYSVAVG